MEESLSLRLDFQQKTPLTEQIRKGIYRLIEQQELESGDLLPTVRQLAAQLGVNFNTVARAYRALDMAGIITTRQGRGTYVVGLHAAKQEPSVEPPLSLKKRVEQFLLDAEKDGISRREIARAVQALAVPEHKAEKIQVRYRVMRKKKTPASDSVQSEERRSPLPRIKNVRVTRRKTSKAMLFHVKHKETN